MKITNVKSIILISMLVVLESGCATIVSDSDHLVGMGSTPTDAEFLVRNQDGVEVHKGRTPSTLFGGLLGFLLIDPATGAMFSLPDSLQVSLGDPLVAPLAAERDYQPASSATALVQDPLDEP